MHKYTNAKTIIVGNQTSKFLFPSAYYKNAIAETYVSEMKPLTNFSITIFNCKIHKYKNVLLSNQTCYVSISKLRQKRTNSSTTSSGIKPATVWLPWHTTKTQLQKRLARGSNRQLFNCHVQLQKHLPRESNQQLFHSQINYKNVQIQKRWVLESQ